MQILDNNKWFWGFIDDKSNLDYFDDNMCTVQVHLEKIVVWFALICWCLFMCFVVCLFVCLVQTHSLAGVMMRAKRTGWTWGYFAQLGNVAESQRLNTWIWILGNAGLNTLGYFAQLDGSPKVWGYLKIKIVAENDSDYSDRWSRLLLRVVVTRGLLPGTRQMLSGTARY